MHIGRIRRSNLDFGKLTRAHRTRRTRETRTTAMLGGKSERVLRRTLRRPGAERSRLPYAAKPRGRGRAAEGGSAPTYRAQQHPSLGSAVDASGIIRDGHRAPKEKSELLVRERLHDFVGRDAGCHTARLRAAPNVPGVAVEARGLATRIMEYDHRVAPARNRNLDSPV